MLKYFIKVGIQISREKNYIIFYLTLEGNIKLKLCKKLYAAKAFCLTWDKVSLVLAPVIAMVGLT